MSHLIETLCLIDGKIRRPEYHQWRMTSSARELFGTIPLDQSLDKLLNIPDEYSQGKVKCRIIYGESIEGISFSHYAPRIVNSLRVVNGDGLEYSHKFEDRNSINLLFDQRADCDDILILQDGLLTDSSIANILFFDAAAWWTPVQPLLKGTQRQYLLDQGRVGQREIRVATLAQFSHFKLVNAMMEFAEAPTLLVSAILG